MVAGQAFHPYMIDVQDCDTRLPSSGDLNDLYMDELVHLSILLGCVGGSYQLYQSIQVIGCGEVDFLARAD